MAMVVPTAEGAEGGPGRVVGLVWHLQLKQRALGLTNEAMARELGVSRNYWYRLRTDNRDPGWSLIGRILAKWPGEFDHLVPDLARRRASGARRGSGA
jgi:transcriptional regulator with XRE-family HTH domain